MVDVESRCLACWPCWSGRLFRLTRNVGSTSKDLPDGSHFECNQLHPSKTGREMTLLVFWLMISGLTSGLMIAAGHQGGAAAR